LRRFSEVAFVVKNQKDSGIKYNSRQYNNFQLLVGVIFDDKFKKISESETLSISLL